MFSVVRSNESELCCAHAVVQYLPCLTVNCSCISSSRCLLSFSCYCGVLRAHLEMRRPASVHYSYLTIILFSLYSSFFLFTAWKRNRSRVPVCVCACACMCVCVCVIYIYIYTYTCTRKLPDTGENGNSKNGEKLKKTKNRDNKREKNSYIYIYTACTRKLPDTGEEYTYYYYYYWSFLYSAILRSRADTLRSTWVNSFL